VEKMDRAHMDVVKGKVLVRMEGQDFVAQHVLFGSRHIRWLLWRSKQPLSMHEKRMLQYGDQILGICNHTSRICWRMGDAGLRKGNSDRENMSIERNTAPSKLAR